MVSAGHSRLSSVSFMGGLRGLLDLATRWRSAYHSLLEAVISSTSLVPCWFPSEIFWGFQYICEKLLPYNSYLPMMIKSGKRSDCYYRWQRCERRISHHEPSASTELSAVYQRKKNRLKEIHSHLSPERDLSAPPPFRRRCRSCFS